MIAAPPIERTRPVADDRLVATGWALLGAFVGSRPLADNSLLSHVATGRLVLDSGVPEVDPFTWTGAGTPWMVQGWGAAAMYALLERVGGAGLIRLSMAAAAALLVLTLWRLTRPAGDLLARCSVMVPVALMTMASWPQRPALLGLVLLAGTLVIVSDGRPWWWLVPLFALWGNLHGSFALGWAAILALGAMAMAEGRRPVAEARALGGALLGSLLAALGPLGFAGVTFPLTVGADSGVLEHLSEWQRPGLGFAPLWGMALVAIAGSLGMVRSGRPAGVAVVAVIGVAGVSAVRFVLPATIILLALAAPRWPVHGSIEVGPGRGRRAAGAVALAGSVLITASCLTGEAWRLDSYPAAVVDRAEAEGLIVRPEARLLASERTGNYLEWRYGTDARVFTDDRALPAAAFLDVVDLFTGAEDPGAILERWRPTVVIWADRGDTADWLRTSREWRVIEESGGFLLAVPA